MLVAIVIRGVRKHLRGRDPRVVTRGLPLLPLGLVDELLIPSSEAEQDLRQSGRFCCPLATPAYISGA